MHFAEVQLFEKWSEGADIMFRPAIKTQWSHRKGDVQAIFIGLVGDRVRKVDVDKIESPIGGKMIVATVDLDPALRVGDDRIVDRATEMSVAMRAHAKAGCGFEQAAA